MVCEVLKLEDKNSAGAPSSQNVGAKENMEGIKETLNKVQIEEKKKETLEGVREGQKEDREEERAQGKEGQLEKELEAHEENETGGWERRREGKSW